MTATDLPQRFDLGYCTYQPVWRAMQRFTTQRHAATRDQIWFVEHPPIFTLGRNAQSRHLLNTGDIPVVPIDRGGQVTYHGPGQLVAYLLLDLKRRGLGVRALVSAIEHALIRLLAESGISADALANAPGVYVGNAKIAALGLRIRRGCSYHGLSLNLDMDLTPFQRINPCGFQRLPITQIKHFHPHVNPTTVRDRLFNTLCQELTRQSP